MTPNPHPLPKLAAPRSAGIVPRTRVQNAIDRGLRSGICWVAAPAGYGKTTAVVDFIRKKRGPHVWYRIDEGDQDIASFFHYMALSLPSRSPAGRLPVFGPEYADQAQEFARRFFRAYFARLVRGKVLVLDDVHRADASQFNAVLGILLRELPESMRCACLSRTLPPPELADLTFNGRLTVVDEPILRFSESEARALVAKRLAHRAAAIDVSAARGWAAGLVLLADRASAGSLHADVPRSSPEGAQGTAIFGALAAQVLGSLTRAEQDALLKLSLLREITPDLAVALTGWDSARALLDGLHQRQLLVKGGSAARIVFQLHDLLREFLRERLVQLVPPRDLAALWERTAALLEGAGHAEEAVDAAIQARAWPLARRLMVAQAETLLARGKRATLIGWSAALPEGEGDDAQLCYWLGVANMADDATATSWLERAWSLFAAQGDLKGRALTAARAVLSKTDSWRTHEGLSVWTKRLLGLLDQGSRGWRGDEPLLVWAGMLRALDFAEDYRTDAPAVKKLASRLLERLAFPKAGDAPTLRTIASETLMEHAGSTGQAAVFENAVDSVAGDLRDPEVSPLARGLWLVAFGTVSGRYFPYARRGFPYASAEDALRAAIQLGEREGLRGVEFGGLYHLQLLMKLRGDFSEFEGLVGRLAEIADSRYTTQVAVVADCQAALHTMQGNHARAHAACDRFMAAIEAANEPPIERWPHFITRFQALLGDRRAGEAREFLEGVLPLFDGEVRRRTAACILVAQAFEAKWRQDANYPEHLRACVRELASMGWLAVLINLPRLAAELCGDALEHGIEPEFSRSFIKRRRLMVPDRRPGSWPWPLRVHALGEFRLEQDGVPVDLGAKAPTRTLDLIRVLAIAKDQTRGLEDVYESLWPDADGDQAKAACEQALHRLRRLLGVPDLVSQREGKLRLSPGLVWVDLDNWETDLKRASQLALSEAADAELERVYWSFPGPLFQGLPETPWSLPAAERVRSKFIELATRIGKRHDSRGDHAKARTYYLRALDLYPTSERCYEALLRGRLAQADVAGALEDYRRCEKVLQTTLEAGPSPVIRSLMAPHLTGPTGRRPA